MRISDWSSDVCSSDLSCAEQCAGIGSRIKILTAQESERIISRYKRLGWRVDPSICARQKEPQRSPPAQGRECSSFRFAQAKGFFITGYQCGGSVCMIVTPIEIKAPGAMGHGQIISPDIGAAEIEIDEAAHFVAQHQHIVREQEIGRASCRERVCQ